MCIYIFCIFFRAKMASTTCADMSNKVVISARNWPRYYKKGSDSFYCTKCQKPVGNCQKKLSQLKRHNYCESALPLVSFCAVIVFVFINFVVMDFKIVLLLIYCKRKVTQLLTFVVVIFRVEKLVLISLSTKPYMNGSFVAIKVTKSSYSYTLFCVSKNLSKFKIGALVLCNSTYTTGQNTSCVGDIRR